MDFSSLSLAELKNLLNLLPAEIKKKEKEEKAKTLKELEAFAAERGFTLEELVGTSPEKKERVSVAIKFRHPQHPELVWSGRGKRPKWLVDFLNENGSLQQLAV